MYAGAELEWNLGKEKLEGKDSMEMRNKIGNFWKKRRDLREEHRSTSMDREEKEMLQLVRSRRGTQIASCFLLNFLYSVLRKIKTEFGECMEAKMTEER